MAVAPALLRQLARRLRSQRVTAVGNRLVDHLQVLAQRRRQRRIQWRIALVGYLFETRDGPLLMLGRLVELEFDGLDERRCCLTGLGRRWPTGFGGGQRLAQPEQRPADDDSQQRRHAHPAP